MATSSSAPPCPTATLPSGDKIPLFGLGTFLSKPEEVTSAVEKALELGYRHIDTAEVYGNQEAVGKGIANFLAKQSDLKREDLFITTKLSVQYAEPQFVRDRVTEDLKALGLDYVIHHPYALNRSDPPKPIGYDPDRILGVWRELEQLVNEKKLRNIGISNFTASKLEKLKPHAKVPIAVNQVELHPNLAQPDLLEACEKAGVHVTAFSPLGNPGHKGKDSDTPSPLENQTIKDLAEKHGKTPAQVLIRWAIQRGTSVIPKSTNPKRIEENMGALSFELSEEDMKTIGALDEGNRIMRMHFLVPEGETWEDLWK